MPKIAYVSRRFEARTLDLIGRANEIIDDYAEQGLTLTLRQLYYRFVAAGAIPNTQQDYSRLGDVVSNARLAGLMDWDAIEDRGRNLEGASHWDSPAEIVEAAARSYRIDRWSDQRVRVEVWVEKQALEGVIAQACDPLDVAYFACKGYTSQSEMWRASQRFRRYLQAGQVPVVIHLGDHDPSGVDMTRDIEERLNDLFGLSKFIGADVRIPVQRIALNMAQIEEHDPPPNPAKLSDSRARAYIAKYGDSSWELDALDPATLRQLIQDSVTAICDKPKYARRVREEEAARKTLVAAAERWDEIEALVAAKANKTTKRATKKATKRTPKKGSKR